MAATLPAPLRPGDTIAIVPTARAITAQELGDGIALAESWGLHVQLGAGVGRKHFQQAGTDGERAADLQAAIDDPAVKAIWCARGGYGTIRIMDRVDLSPLLHTPKWLIGFSDVTVLHNALTNLGVASLHGQMPFAIGAKSQACRDGLRNVLFGDLSAGTIPTLRSTAVTSMDRHGHGEGLLIGGNLSILYSLRGTPYDLDPRGRILFLEDLDELRYHADRMIQNLRHGGWFSALTGLVSRRGGLRGAGGDRSRRDERRQRGDRAGRRRLFRFRSGETRRVRPACPDRGQAWCHDRRLFPICLR